MDNEVHYLTYDPEQIMVEMLTAYVDAGGDPLYPGDEKFMLLRAFQAIMVQAFAGIDNALRMDTLRYAVGEYLDIYGEKRGCARIRAAKAKVRVLMNISGSSSETEIPEGTAMTADGKTQYLTTESIQVTAYPRQTTAVLECLEAGTAGNALNAGVQLSPLQSVSCISSCVTQEAASGGNDDEDDESYRERIRTYGLRSVTAGPSGQYESIAKSVSTDIVDAKAVSPSAGVVNVYLLAEEEAQTVATLTQVNKALNDKSVRPLTDSVSVSFADPVEYLIEVKYKQPVGSNIRQALEKAAEDFIATQDREIGRTFNPDILKAMLYQAGASLITFGENSHFDDGPVEITEIDPDQYCSGTITLSEITE